LPGPATKPGAAGRLCVGLMSGTSLDGVDAVLARFPPNSSPQILSHQHTPLLPKLIQRLRGINGQSALAEALSLDAELAHHYAHAVNRLLADHSCPAESVDAIGLHGQTVWHAPDADPPVTCQLGDPSRLAQATGITVVADFRQRDLAMGGQGAPLAPLFHGALFSRSGPRAVLNLGGIANLTLMDAGGAILGGHDCGPANTLMDAWARRHLNQPHDAAGAWAASAAPDPGLLEKLLADPYFQRPPPKSTGPERFNLNWLESHRVHTLDRGSVQATLAELTVESVAGSLEAAPVAVDDLVLCGGGTANRHLVKRLEERLEPLPVITSDALGYPAGSIEALGFAWLADAALEGRKLSLENITGARRPARLGGIYPA